jgi:acyl-CoA hydrolase
MNHDYSSPVDSATLEITAAALRQRGIQVSIVPNAAAARDAVLTMIPHEASVMTMTSQTNEGIGLYAVLNDITQYPNTVRAKLGDATLTERTKKQLAAAPEYAVGSVHAVTQDGQIIIASGTGSQLPAYSYGADHVIWVVGAQKIVPTYEAAVERLYSYVLPLESERARKAYGVERSNVSQMLTINNDLSGQRMHVVLVAEMLGY